MGESKNIHSHSKSVHEEMVREDGEKKIKFAATVAVQHCSRHQQDKGINRRRSELGENAGI